MVEPQLLLRTTQWTATTVATLNSVCFETRLPFHQAPEFKGGGPYPVPFLSSRLPTKSQDGPPEILG